MSAMSPRRKVELHCHLPGLLTPDLLDRAARVGFPSLADPERLRALRPLRSRSQFAAWLDCLRPYQSAPSQAWELFLAHHVNRLISQNVVYAELMVSPAHFPAEERDLVRVFERWRALAFELERGFVQLEFVLVVPRSLGPEALDRDAKNFLALHREGLVCGVALVGPETGESTARFERTFATWRDAGLGIEVHAGEHDGPESVEDALRFLRPHRLGHGLSALACPGLVERLLREQIHVEVCLTSNLCTGAVKSLEAHPARRIRATGLSFSIDTDNPGAFECDLEGEHALAERFLGLDEDAFEEVFQNSLRARFATQLRCGAPSVHR